MNVNWTDAKSWQEKGPAAGELSTIRRLIEGRPPEAYGDVVPDLLDYLRLQRRGIAHLFDALQQITKYNEASHVQQARQIEVVRTLVAAVKEQDRQIKRLGKQVDNLEKRAAKLAAKASARR